MECQLTSETPESEGLPPKRILFLGGSARRNGNSEAILETISAAASESAGIQDSIGGNGGVDSAGVTRGVEASSFFVASTNVSPCISCDGCFSTGECIIPDDMSTFLALADDADVLVVVTPIYFAGVPAQLKALYDRLQQRWAQRYLLGVPVASKRPAVLCLVGTGEDPYGYDPAVQTTKSALAMLGFRVVQTVPFIGFESRTSLYESSSNSSAEDQTIHYERAKEIGRSLTDLV